MGGRALAAACIGTRSAVCASRKDFAVAGLCLEIDGLPLFVHLLCGVEDAWVCILLSRSYLFLIYHTTESSVGCVGRETRH